MFTTFTECPWSQAEYREGAKRKGARQGQAFETGWAVFSWGESDSRTKSAGPHNSGGFSWDYLAIKLFVRVTCGTTRGPEPGLFVAVLDPLADVGCTPPAAAARSSA